MSKFNGPVVNLNGADRGALIRQHTMVYDAAEKLLVAMGLAFPHGRDYQTVSQAQYDDDRKAYEAWLETVNEIFKQNRAVVERLVMEQVK